MSSTLQLNCLIWGKYSSSVFEIAIEGTESVSSLKRAIKTEGDLGHVNLNNIILYQTAISIPLDNHDFEANKEFERAVYKVLDHKPALRNKQKISDVFSGNVNDEELHVVVSFESVG